MINHRSKENPLEDPVGDHLPNPMRHPQEQPTGTDDAPRFGRLLAVLALAVILVLVITFASEAYFSQ
jgi:hypothetical protein